MQISATWVPTSLNLGSYFTGFHIPGVRGPACTSLRGLFPTRWYIRLASPVQISGVQTPRSEIRDSAAVALEEEDWTARSDQAVTPSPPGEASRARPSGREKAEEEVARGKASLPLSQLGRAAGGPQEESEALGHHSDPYQVRHGVQGRGSLCLVLRRKGAPFSAAGPGQALTSGWGSPAGPVVSL